MSWCACQEVGMRSVGEGAWTRVYQICKLGTCIDVYYCPRNELGHRHVASAPPPDFFSQRRSFLKFTYKEVNNEETAPFLGDHVKIEVKMRK